ncbi:zinc ribbon domain-containing protein [Anaerovorax odorimutans]|uniref:zinc ribbon domain-containing protein n=1 Tax=Anaerovorax odorimutans TaxID=109327 RepID=UPI0003F7DA25|nr:zinc ribbon domain-containing protein [Anaerovorax odorimutans]
MFCPYCEKELPDNARYCANCGSSLISFIDSEIKTSSLEETNNIGNDDENQNKHKSVKGKRILILLFIISLIFLILFKFHTQIVKFTPFNGIHNRISSEEGDEKNKEHKIISLSDTDLNIYSDKDYIYYLSDNEMGIFYRIDKNTREVDLMFEVYADMGEIDGERLILSAKSFTICGDYMYFSFKPIEMGFPSAYFRMPKEGGKAEFLFLLPESFMVEYKNKIYFLLEDSKKIAVYNPEKKGLPEFIKVMDNPKGQRGMKAKVAVADGYLYYTGTRDNETALNCYRTKLSTGKSEILIDNKNRGFEEILNGIFVDNYFYYSTLFYDDINIVRKYNLDTGENRILTGFEGEDSFLSTFNGDLIIPYSEVGKYVQVNLENNEDVTEFYEGEKYETDNSIENAVNAALGRPLEENVKIINRETLRKQIDGYALESFRGCDTKKNKKFEWSSDRDDYTPVCVIKDQAAMREAVELMVKYKNTDCSNGVNE